MRSYQIHDLWYFLMIFALTNHCSEKYILLTDSQLQVTQYSNGVSLRGSYLPPCTPKWFVTVRCFFLWSSKLGVSDGFHTFHIDISDVSPNHSFGFRTAISNQRHGMSFPIDLVLFPMTRGAPPGICVGWKKHPPVRYIYHKPLRWPGYKPTERYLGYNHIVIYLVSMHMSHAEIMLFCTTVAGFGS